MSFEHKLTKQATFTRPKYLGDLAGLPDPVERRINWHEMAIAVAIGFTIAAGCLWLLACWHVVP